MKKLMIAGLIGLFFISSVQASELIDNRIQFNTWQGYIHEKFVVPEGKNCLTSLTLQSMDKDGGYRIAISETDYPTILFQADEGGIADGDPIVVDLEQTPVTPGMSVMINVVYFLFDQQSTFSVPVRPGGTEIGHNDITDILSILMPIVLPDYTAFSLEYGCGQTSCINTAPVFTKGSDQKVKNIGKPQLIAGWAEDIRSGDSECESGQALTFILTSDNDALFSQTPQIDPLTGNLTFTPAENAHGSAEVTVVLKDDGGIEHGGTDAGSPQTFTIKLFVPGNIDGKDAVDLKDAILTLKLSAGIESDDICLDADVNDDHRIGMEEAMVILQTVSGFR